jgi:phosphinothricin tripeptide acetyl hydrolase
VASAELSLVRELIELNQPNRTLSIAQRRQHYDLAEAAFGDVAPPGERVVAGHVAGEWVRARRGDEDDKPVLVYLHGGTYSLGSVRSHRHVAAAIGDASGAAVLALDYRLAPEYAFPAAVADALAAYRWLLGCGVRPARIVLAGDSAGGGLAVATMVALRDEGDPLPAAGVCISPWADLACAGASHVTKAGCDPLLVSGELRCMAKYYLRGADSRHPLASPVYADLTGLPPLLVQVGTDEILLDDARALARSARDSGVAVTLEEWPEVVHAWHWYFPVLAEGRHAIKAIGTFVAATLGAGTPGGGDADVDRWVL